MHQELPLLPNLSAQENVVIGVNGPSLRRHRPSVARELYRANVRSIPDAPSPDALVRDLSVADRQKVALVRALSLRPELLVIDEGTSSVSLLERQRIYELVRTIANEHRIGVIYITHFVEDALAVSDRIEVLRDGRNALSAQTSQLTKRDILAAMSGGTKRAASPKADAVESLPPTTRRAVARSTQPGLVIRELGASRVSGVDLTVSVGEAIGIFGHPGCGASELLEAVAGVRPHTGSISWQGRELPKSVSRRVRANVLYVSGDRAKNLLATWSVLDNAALVQLSRRSLLARASTRRFRPEVRDMLERFQVKGDPDSQVRQLSGGNQQKVILGRAASTPAPVLLLGDDPTRGVDVVARADIHRMLNSAVEGGISMLVYSSDPEELLSLCKQIVIMVEGRIVTQLPAESLTAATLERYAHSRTVDA